MERDDSRKKNGNWVLTINDVFFFFYTHTNKYICLNIGAAFNSLWLVAVRQVDCVLLTAGQHQRMLLRGKMSALFNSLGPALGAIVSGLLVDACINKNIMAFSGFMYSYRAAVVLLAFCWAISRGWTVVADDGL